jgi:hypothetical protein
MLDWDGRREEKDELGEISYYNFNPHPNALQETHA